MSQFRKLISTSVCRQRSLSRVPVISSTGNCTEIVELGSGALGSSNFHRKVFFDFNPVLAGGFFREIRRIIVCREIFHYDDIAFNS